MTDWSEVLDNLRSLANLWGLKAIVYFGIFISIPLNNEMSRLLGNHSILFLFVIAIVILWINIVIERQES